MNKDPLLFVLHIQDDLNRIWNVIEKDIPLLKVEIENILQKENKK